MRESFTDAKILAQPFRVQVSLSSWQPPLFAAPAFNLTDNAVKYNQPGGLVTLQLRRADHSAEFVVTNTGPGIPPEVLPRVFDRFFRGDASHNRDDESCGLGLSICQWIVRAHGGNIQIESPAGRPVTVTVRLPLCP